MVPQRSDSAPEGALVYVIPESRYTVKELPTTLRPREEMARVGPEHVPDVVLLAIVLRSGAPGLNVVDLAAELLQRFGSLTALSRSSVEELVAQRIRGLGPVKAMELVAALQLGKRLMVAEAAVQPCVRSPLDVVRLLRPRIGGSEQEHFWVILVDAKNRVKGLPQEVSRGILDASLVHPREVFRRAIRSASAAVILAHNHPSGDPTPSAEDLRITRQLIAAGAIVDIRVLDHVVIGEGGGSGGGHTSLREAGLVDFK